MSGCCGLSIVQLGGPGAPFTFSVTGGNSPYNGGLGVITGPIVVNSGDILHLFSANTIDFNVTPGSVNIGSEVRIDPNPLNTITSSAAGIVPVTAGDFKWVKLHGIWSSGVSSTWLSSGDL